MIPEYFEHLPVYDGLPVPYVAMWSNERAPDAVRYQHWRHIDWIYTEARSGMPDFGSTNSHRQRDCMAAMLCQICGKPGADLFVIPDDGDGGTHVELWAVGLILNPPMHMHCFEASASICPHLLKHDPIATFGSTQPLPVVAYTTGLMALPITVAVPGVIGRELIVDSLR